MVFIVVFMFFWSLLHVFIALPIIFYEIRTLCKIEIKAILCCVVESLVHRFETAAMNKKRFTFALSNRSTSVRCWESASIHKKVVINTFFAVLHYKLKMSIHTNQEENSLERMKKKLCFLSIGGRLFNRLDGTKFILVSFSSHMNLFYLAGIVVVVVVFSSLHWNCFPFL